MGFDSKRDFVPPTILLGLLLSLGCGYFSLVGSNILLSMVVQQRVVILKFLQEKMSAYPSNCHLRTRLQDWAVPGQTIGREHSPTS